MLNLSLAYKQSLAFFLFVLLLGLGHLALFLPKNQENTLYFLNVGQGDAIFLQAANGVQILIDGGPNNEIMSELSAVMPFFDRELDLVVLTHPDKDHMFGLIAVLQRLKVKNVLLTGVIKKDANYAEFLRTVRDSGARIYLAEAQKDFWLGGILIDVLFPFEKIGGSEPKDVNESSIALMLHLSQRKVLLTGDLGAGSEKVLLKKYGDYLQADVLKAGHHGSKNSSDAIFVKKIKAPLAVISAGKNNRYGHPDPLVIRNLYRGGARRIFETAKDGRIKIIFESTHPTFEASLQGFHSHDQYN